MMYAIQLDMYQAAAVAALVLLFGPFSCEKFGSAQTLLYPGACCRRRCFLPWPTWPCARPVSWRSPLTPRSRPFYGRIFLQRGLYGLLPPSEKGRAPGPAVLRDRRYDVCAPERPGRLHCQRLWSDPGWDWPPAPSPWWEATDCGLLRPAPEKAGVSGASAVAIASATFGLVAGCVIGGPTAVSRIRQKNLHSFETATGSNEVVVDKNEVTGAIDSGRFLNAALCLALAIGAGTVVSAWLNKVFTFPIYIGAMLVAAFIRNTTDMAGKEIPMEEISTIGSFSLSLFLGLAMMGLKLWELADLAVPMVVMLVAQTVLMMVYAYFVVFNLLGKNYDAAVMTSGFCGFGMGATPNAMANMQAITQKYGPAPTAYFVVPLVGSLFIDFMNTIIITSFLNLL